MRCFRLLASVIFLLSAASCSIGPRAPVTQAPVSNAFYIPATNQEAVWERVVDVLHDYRFEIARENKLDGFIETEYKTGSSILEPWHIETVGLEDRLESTFQSIRRKVFVRIARPMDGSPGFHVSVESFKELEDLEGVAANSPGGATFQDNSPLERDLNVVLGQSTPSGWIAMGRDFLLERHMLGRLQSALSR
jgi:hypothetical protein